MEQIASQPPARLTCTRCGEDKPLVDFPTRVLEPRYGKSCRSCRRAATEKWERENPEKKKSNRQSQYAKWREQFPKVVPVPLVTEEGRLCRSCNTRKTDDAFYRRPESKAKTEWRCKECVRAKHTAWRRKESSDHKEKSRVSARLYRQRNPEKHRESARRQWLKRKYGLSVEQFDALFASQGGCCEICSLALVVTGPKTTPNLAVVDHCHESGRVRAILCVGCNSGLGHFRESADALVNALAYLRRHQEVTA